jgi:hypothetical protein
VRTRTVIVALFFALIFVCAGVSTYQGLRWRGGDAGWRPAQTGGGVQVWAVTPGGPATALRVGDRVVSINGEPITAAAQVWRAWPGAPGVAYTTVVERDGQRQEYTLRTASAPFVGWLTWFTLGILTPVFFLFTGLTVFLLRRDDKQALLLALLLGLFAVAGTAVETEGLPRWLAALLIVGSLVGGWFFPLFTHFFLVFPERSPLLRRFPRLEALLYLPALFILFPDQFIFAVSTYGSPSLANSLRPLDAVLSPLANPLIGLYFLGAFVSLAVSYRRASKLAKRKLRVVLAGIFGGVLPGVLIFFLLPLVKDQTAADWLVVAGYLLFLLIPLSFAYAIVRHQVIPVSLIVRRSVQYLLAKNALRALLLLPAAGLLLSVALDPNRSVADLLLRNSTYFYALLVAAVAAGLVFRRRLNEWIDRKFFREQYDQEKILRGLVEEIKGLDSIAEMSRRVSAEVERALHPESVYLFYRGGERSDLSLTYSSGGAAQDLRIPEDFQLLRLMELQGGAQDFPFPPKTNLPRHEKEWLARTGARLIVPMTNADRRLAGLFLLGDKKSEVPYTARDRELLESVAGQAAVVYENARLRERAREDRRVRREVLSRFEGRGANLLKECPACGRCFDTSEQRCEADGSELVLTLPVERVIEGRYRLERLVGRGGMGAVYEATHLKLRSRVAVKILSGRLFGDGSALRRFGREARALARLGQHPNIVAVHDYGELQTEGAFLVMDFIEGESLAALLRRERRLAPERAARVFSQVLEGVRAAHLEGIVHRDLKPENILISEGERDAPPRVRLLDFGLAKLTRADAADAQTATTPGLVMGTFGYMPPEQLTGGEVDERSDLFSVGVMTAEALTGRRPFHGRTVVELLHSMEREEFRLPGDAPEIKTLDAALRRSLARDRARRFSSAEEMRAALIPALDACPPLDDAPALDAETVMLRDRPAPSL